MNLLIIISGSKNAPVFEYLGLFLIEWLKVSSSLFVYVAEMRSASLSADK